VEGFATGGEQIASRPQAWGSRADPGGGYLQELDFRLTYSDCDPAGLVYFAAYYPWMERTVTEWWLGSGVEFGSMLERFGAFLVARSTGCEYLAAARPFDLLTARLRLSALGRTSITFAIDIVRRTDDVQVARGTYTLVSVDADQRPSPVPDSIRRMLGS
jgi:acyl-CoA thioester hydrolase